MCITCVAVHFTVQVQTGRRPGYHITISVKLQKAFRNAFLKFTLKPIGSFIYILLEF